MEVLERVKQECPEIEVIMVTAFSSVETAVEAMRKGAREYIAKPLSIPLLVEKVANLRELLISRHEINDYRYALSVIEEDVSRSVQSAERRLNDLSDRMEQIKHLFDEPLAAEEKLRRISAHIDEFNPKGPKGPKGPKALMSPEGPISAHVEVPSKAS